MALNHRQQAFVNEYLVDFNATRAAERAGYRGSANTLAVTGYDLLRNPNVGDAIKCRLSETVMSPEEVQSRLAEQGRSDLADFLKQTGDTVTVDLSTAIEAKKTGLIKKLSQTRTVRTRGDDTEETVSTTIELYDKQAALVQLAKINGMMLDRSEVTTSVEHSVSKDLAKMIEKVYGTGNSGATSADDATLDDETE